jgi:hypothetical protein
MSATRGTAGEADDRGLSSAFDPKLPFTTTLADDRAEWEAVIAAKL